MRRTGIQLDNNSRKLAGELLALHVTRTRFRSLSGYKNEDRYGAVLPAAKLFLIVLDLYIAQSECSDEVIDAITAVYTQFIDNFKKLTADGNRTNTLQREIKVYIFIYIYIFDSMKWHSFKAHQAFAYLALIFIDTLRPRTYSYIMKSSICLLCGLWVILVG